MKTLPSVSVEYQLNGDTYIVLLRRHSYEILKPGTVAPAVDAGVLKGALQAITRYCSDRSGARDVVHREGGLTLLILAAAESAGFPVTPIQVLSRKAEILNQYRSRCVLEVVGVDLESGSVKVSVPGWKPCVSVDLSLVQIRECIRGYEPQIGSRLVADVNAGAVNVEDLLFANSIPAP